MSALSKLTDYLNRLNYIGIEKHMDEYMSFCPQFFSEKDRAAGKANGGPNNEEYCKPEEEVNYKFSNQPKRTLQADQYPQPSTIIAKQEDPSEPAKESETVADMKKRKNDDTVRTVNSTSDGSVNNDNKVKYSKENNGTKDASSTYNADHVRGLEAAKGSCEISTQQEESTPAEQYPQTITVQEVPSENVKGTEVVACTKKKDEGNPGHDPVNSKTVTDDVTEDEDTIATSSTYTTDHEKVMRGTKGNCESSIRQEESP